MGIVDRWHYGRNDGNIEAELISFYCGVKGTLPAVTKEKDEF